MKDLTFTKEDLRLIGLNVAGTFCQEEGDTLIYSSHTRPSHRITVDKKTARYYLDCYHEMFKKRADE